MRLLRESRGAALLEMALVLPLFVVLLFGIVDFGRYFAAASSVNTASRESARYGSSVGDSINGIPRFTDCDEIIAAGTSYGVAHNIESGNYTISYDHGPETAEFATCPFGGPSPDPSAFTDSDRVVVHVSTTFEFITPLLGDLIGSVTLDSVDKRSLLSP